MISQPLVRKDQHHHRIQYGRQEYFPSKCGVNMILATMGAPVCATKMTVSPLKVMTSMRIKDNLEESTSTFYAELKKLKMIIDAVNSRQPVFILLDEILRGTNSLDRHTGSMALIRQLLHHDATGIVATHDLELAGMSQQFSEGIHNYYLMRRSMRMNYILTIR